MELRELRLIVSRYLPIAFVVFLLCVVAGFAAAFLPAKTYRTSATIVLDINNDPELGGVSVQQATFLLPAIEQRAVSVSTRERAASDVPEALRRTRVQIDAVSDVSVLRIRGTSTSPEASQAWVNAIADRLVEEQSDLSPVVLSVLDAAPLKRRPIAPNVEPILAAFVVVGLIAGLFSTLAADRIKRAFDTSQTVRERMGTTVLGEIPVLRRRTERRRPVIPLLSGRSSSSVLSNAFEVIRTNVEFRLAQAGANRIAVVTLNPNPDRSMIAAGLGYSLAAVGRDVVAIEADLRRPTLSEQLGVPPSAGLGDVATFGSKAFELQPTQQPGLEMLPAGAPVGRPSDIVTTTLPWVLDQLDDGNRTLLVDSPPLRGAPESTIVVASTRHVVLVVNSRSSEFADLSDAIELIDDAGGVLLGVIVSGVPRRRISQLDDHRMTRSSRHGSDDVRERVGAASTDER